MRRALGVDEVFISNLVPRERCAFPARTASDHKSNSFNKERDMINNLITLEEASEDAEHKGWCNTELTTNTHTRERKRPQPWRSSTILWTSSMLRWKI